LRKNPRKRGAAGVVPPPGRDAGVPDRRADAFAIVSKTVCVTAASIKR